MTFSSAAAVGLDYCFRLIIYILLKLKVRSWISSGIPSTRESFFELFLRYYVGQLIVFAFQLPVYGFSCHSEWNRKFRKSDENIGDTISAWKWIWNAGKKAVINRNLWNIVVCIRVCGSLEKFYNCMFRDFDKNCISKIISVQHHIKADRENTINTS